MGENIGPERINLMRTALLVVLIGSVRLLMGDGPQPDRWRGLIVGESTAADAVRVLGTPESDKPDRLFIRRIDKWFIPGLRAKSLRKQSFRDVEGFSRVDLYYYQERLAIIQLEPSKHLDPNALGNIYGVTFTPFVDRLAEAMFPRDFERNQGRIYPKRYPDEYSLVAVTERSVLAAEVRRMGFGSTLTGSLGMPDSSASFPGKVDGIQIISRALENREGSDLLK